MPRFEKAGDIFAHKRFLILRYLYENAVGGFKPSKVEINEAVGGNLGQTGIYINEMTRAHLVRQEIRGRMNFCEIEPGNRELVGRLVDIMEAFERLPPPPPDENAAKESEDTIRELKKKGVMK